MSFGIGLSRVFMGFILMDGMQLIELRLIVASGRLLYKCFKFFFFGTNSLYDGYETTIYF